MDGEHGLKGLLERLVVRGGVWGRATWEGLRAWRESPRWPRARVFPWWTLLLALGPVYLRWWLMKAERWAVGGSAKAVVERWVDGLEHWSSVYLALVWVALVFWMVIFWLAADGKLPRRERESP